MTKTAIAGAMAVVVAGAVVANRPAIAGVSADKPATTKRTSTSPSAGTRPAVPLAGLPSKPGEYVLSVLARAPADGKITVSGIEGGDQTLTMLDGGGTVKATVKVGEKPVTLETGFYGELVWVTLIQQDSRKE